MSVSVSECGHGRECVSMSASASVSMGMGVSVSVGVRSLSARDVREMFLRLGHAA